MGGSKLLQANSYGPLGALLLVVAIGLVTGTAGALALGRWLSALTFQVSPSDPRILAGTSVVVAMTVVVASWLPARRASRVDPAATMRE